MDEFRERHSVIAFIRFFGRAGLGFLSKLGEAGVFIARVVFSCPQRFRQVPRLLIQQIFSVGVLSVPIVLLSALFIGMVVSLQGYNTLNDFGASQQLGQLLALSVVRELGPVIGALLFAGRAGSALTAEIGLMKTTEQFSAMEMMAVDPLWRVIAPRFWAGLISLPLLTILFDVVAIYGGYMVGVHWLGVDGGSFWSNMQAAVDFRVDVVNGIIKSIVFAVIIVWVAVYQGYYSIPNALGMGRATTKTVVYSSLLVLGLDFVLTALMMGGW